VISQKPRAGTIRFVKARVDMTLSRGRH
jgi:hypothetical protein